ncbi:MAG: MATE family efflux transporter [Candidatus Muiribacteriaceae bacterium]
MKDKSRRLGTESINSLLIRLSTPAIIGMIVIALYNIVDAVFIGQGVGVDGIAAVTVVLPLHLFIMALSQMIGLGSGSIISRSLGAGDMEKAEKTFGTAILSALCLGFVLVVLLTAFSTEVLQLFGVTDKIFEKTIAYFRIIVFGAPFLMLLITFNNIVRAEGDPKTAMVTMIITGIINAVLDYYFIFILNWGMHGAAVATVTAQAVGVLYLVIYFMRNKSSLRFMLRYFVLKFKILGEIIGVGAASFFRQAIASLLVTILNNLFHDYGTEVSFAVFGVLHRIIMFMLMPLFGILQGANPVIGFNFGACQFDRVKEVIKKAAFVNTGIVTVMWALAMIFPTAVFRMFSDDPVLIKEGVGALRLNMMLAPLIGFQVIGNGMFQALGKIKVSIFLSMLRQAIILIPLLFVLPRFYGLNGIWGSYPISDFLASLITGYFVYRQFHRFHLEECNLQKSRD